MKIDKILEDNNSDLKKYYKNRKNNNRNNNRKKYEYSTTSRTRHQYLSDETITKAKESDRFSPSFMGWMIDTKDSGNPQDVVIHRAITNSVYNGTERKPNNKNMHFLDNALKEMTTD